MSPGPRPPLTENRPGSTGEDRQDSQTTAQYTTDPKTAPKLPVCPVCLLLCWMLLMDPVRTVELGMVEDSVDDMYSGCTDKMKDMQEIKEKKYEENSKVLECSKKTPDRGDEALTENHMKAICVYTSNEIYKEFNNAVRENKSIYKSTFKYHYLHFWLTTAIQTLNNNHHCSTTYRRSRMQFTGQVGNIIRFGSFTSTSLKTNLKSFGSKTCFKITTCLGADLKHYLILESAEQEVLIPPYETFNITAVFKGKDKPEALKDCEVVFVLKDFGASSRLNCALITGSP
ncbi:erythroblast NAD(P)(+)--arginine ADP-ribosyltransferase-like [Seriola lalandi dorsalis]|uniref:erythroblast NAD(P)(+)--arginine ADP-ribosyltransferase-like n=1 Tax=Seriola lalandi dorsalis TaxID=1841481 RepID=UPI000C6F8D55|nr:erythroblast NAD(P)(+)--arginine ADP-ribosyltransferase-like [Seriola lalandi dorsalis]